MKKLSEQLKIVSLRNGNVGQAELLCGQRTF